MSSVLLVHADPSDRSLAGWLEAMNVRVIDAPLDAMTPAMAAEAEAAIIADDVDTPLRVARTIHNAAPQAHIIFLTTAESEPTLRRELLLAPRIGNRWSVARADVRDGLREPIRNALAATAQRRNLRTTLGRFQLRLGEASAKGRTVASDHFLAIVLQQLSDGVITIDTQERIVEVNEAARTLFGATLVRGALLSDALPSGGEELLAGVRAAENDALSELLLDRDGETLALEVRLTRVRDQDAKPIGTAILARNVTERRQSEQRQRLLADAGVALSSTLDLDLAMQRLAEFLAIHLGALAVADTIEEAGVVRRGVAIAGHDALARKLRRYPPARNHPAFRAFESGTPVRFDHLSDDDLRSISHDEEHFDILRQIGVRTVVVMPLAAGKTPIGTLSIARARQLSDGEMKLLADVAEVTARAVQNLWTYRAAEEANRAKEEFLATLSHELRTPMTAVLGWVQLLRGSDVDASLAAEGLEAIDQSARAQAQLIDDLLDVSRIQSGKLLLRTETIDLRQVVRAAVDIVRPAAHAKDIVLTSDLGEPLLVHGDANRVQQVVWNLLSNSVKFTERRGAVRIAVRQQGSQAQVEVSDNGKGIEPEFLPFVFDRFRQADSATTRRYGGLGLGLSIVRQITELHGGSVRVASAGPGLGATFTVSFPIPAVYPVVQPAPEEKDSPSLAGIHVLLVEDDPASARMLTAVLERAGAVVRMRASVASALEALRTQMPDVLVSDIAMPEEDGMGLIRHVRSTLRISAARLPAIALSAFSDVTTRVAVLGAGFQRFLQKPIDTTTLASAIAEMARRSN